MLKKSTAVRLLCSLLTLGVFTNIAAEDFSQTSNVEKQKKTQKKPRMGSAPKCPESGLWNFNADFLWWTTNFNMISGIDVTDNSPPSGDTTNLSIKTKRFEPGWDPGVRLNLGYNTGFDNWDVQGMWTFFYNSMEVGLAPFIGKDGGQTTNSKGSGKNAFHYNAADLELGKSYYISKNFFIRPLVSIHAIWTDIDYNYRMLDPSSLTGFFNGGSNFPLNGGVQNLSIDLDIDVWAVGPRVGFNTNWGQFKGFSMLGNISGSLAYGKLQESLKIKANNEFGQNVIHLKGQSYWQLFPTLQLQLGVSYGMCFNDGKNQFRVNAMWESNFLWEVGNVLILDKSISMQGLTLDFGIMF